MTLAYGAGAVLVAADRGGRATTAGSVVAVRCSTSTASAAGYGNAALVVAPVQSARMTTIMLLLPSLDGSLLPQRLLLLLA